MIETVVAERFDKLSIGGRTEPLRLACRRADGRLVDVVTKFSSTECPPGGLVREAISALLLRDLGIPAANPLLVEFDELFIESLRDGHPRFAAKVAASVVPAYGSENLGSGFFLCSPGDAEIMRPQAAEVWAFDKLTLNPDRLATKPNCLTNGEQIALIDHELALSVVGVGSLIAAPWQAPIQLSEDKHIFWNEIKGRGLDLGRLEASWSRISSRRLEQYASCIPTTWKDGHGTLNEIIDYLLALQQNLAAAFDQLRRVM